MNIKSISAVGFYLIMLASVVWATPVPDSGQTQCYNNTAEISCPSPGQPFYGQDANRSFHPLSYTKLDENGKPLPDSAAKWEMVRDNVTGLIWEMKNNLDGIMDYDNPHDADNTYYWYDDRMNATLPDGITDTQDTESFIKALNSARFGGYCDWRLPTIKELGSIVNFNMSNPGPTIDAGYFPATQSSFYWSATPYAYFTSFVWGVYFNHGHDDFYSNYYEFYARAVRGGASDAEYDPYIDNDNGTVTDPDTGLMWQQAAPENLLTWEQALSYCENLTLAGFSDWRLPSIKELRSLTDYYRYKPSINTTYFPNTNMSFYWSATTFSEIPGNAWGAYYNYGYDHYDVSKSTPSLVRAVRTLGNSFPTSNSIGPRNMIRVSDFSGALAVSGQNIRVRGWDANGNLLSEKADVQPLKLFNHGTLNISGSDLAARFSNNTPMLYQFSVDSSDVVITNEKNATNGSFKVPNTFFNNASHFSSNSIDDFSTVIVTDMSGNVNNCNIIQVTAWDANGVSIPESISAAPLFLFNHGTTAISGSILAARFPSGTPQTYEFAIPSTKVLFTTEKYSTDGAWRYPASTACGVSNFVSNAIRSNSRLVISDLSGKIASGGAVITVTAWDAIGIPVAESESAPPLILASHGTLQVPGTDLAARFPGGTPVTYEFSSPSSKLLFTQINISPDLLTEVPTVFTKGLSSFAANHISSLSTIKISDSSGALPAIGTPITITAYDSTGHLVPESATSAPLLLYKYGTTTIGGMDILNRFTTGNPVLFEFFVSSSSAIVTHLTSSADGIVKVPNVFSVGIPGGI